MGRGIYLGVEGAGTNMSDTGGLIVYKIIGWKITTLEIKGGARAPWPPPWIRPCIASDVVQTSTGRLLHFIA